MNKTRLRSIEKALGDLKPKDEPNPYAGWSLEQLKDHYDQMMIEAKETDFYKELDSMNLDQLMDVWQKRFVEGKN